MKNSNEKLKFRESCLVETKNLFCELQKYNSVKRTQLRMRIHKHKALCSPKFVRAGLSIVVVAALAITGVSYSRRRGADLKLDHALVSLGPPG